MLSRRKENTSSEIEEQSREKCEVIVRQASVAAGRTPSRGARDGPCSDATRASRWYGPAQRS